jgi:hypothetical protein
MGITAKKYEILVSYCHKLAFFGKIEAYHLCILSQILIFLN